MESIEVPTTAKVYQQDEDSNNLRQNNPEILEENDNIQPDKNSDLFENSLHELTEEKERVDVKSLEFSSNKMYGNIINSIQHSTFISLPELEELNENKVVFNAVELLAGNNAELRYLMSPIFQQKGTAVLAGKPGIGKSQLVRQLCIEVALGRKIFLGHELNSVHQRSIYVATEDNQESSSVMVRKQFEGLNEEPVENLRFIFADTMEQSELLKTLDDELKRLPADLVVVDSFGDVFKGGDTNNNMAMRNTVKIFDKIAKENNCLILFVHHINKAGYSQAPGQEQIQGGAGLVQKVRLAVVLSEGEGDIRYFSVVKGNYCPKEFRENSLELLFSEKTFLFENTGNRIALNNMGRQSKAAKDDGKAVKLENLAEFIFQDAIISNSEFVKRFCDKTSKSEVTGKRTLKTLLETKIVEKVEGKYRLLYNDSMDEEFQEVI